MTSFSLILRTGTRYITPFILLLSVFLLLRGHYETGGGFAGGLVAAAGFVLFAFAYGLPQAQQVLRVDPSIFIGLGLLIALISGFIGFFAGQPFLTGVWLPNEVPAIGKLGTPLLFDIGVYLVVLGIVLKIIFSLAEEE